MLRTIHVSHSVLGISSINGERQSQTSKNYHLDYQPESFVHTHIYSMVLKAQKTWECPLSKENSVCVEVEVEKNGSGCEVTRYVFLQ